MIGYMSEVVVSPDVWALDIIVNIKNPTARTIINYQRFYTNFFQKSGNNDLNLIKSYLLKFICYKSLISYVIDSSMQSIMFTAYHWVFFLSSESKFKIKKSGYSH